MKTQSPPSTPATTWVICMQFLELFSSLMMNTTTKCATNAVQSSNYISSCLPNKYVYDRWKRIVMQMIEKDSGCPKLFCLWVIHLYECNLNLLIGIYFKNLQQHIEDRNLFNQGCYGGQPNRCAINPVVVDVTQIELAMVTRRLII